MTTLSAAIFAYAFFFRLCEHPGLCSSWQRIGFYDTFQTCERALYGHVGRFPKAIDWMVQRKCERIELPMDAYRALDTVTK